MSTNNIFIKPENRNCYEKAINYKIFERVSNNFKDKNTAVALLNVKNHWKFLVNK